MTTKELESILARCLVALGEYRRSGGDTFHNPQHAAAMRASMDLTKALAKWRQTPPGEK